MQNWPVLHMILFRDKLICGNFYCRYRSAIVDAHEVEPGRNEIELVRHSSYARSRRRPKPH